MKEGVQSRETGNILRVALDGKTHLLGGREKFDNGTDVTICNLSHFPTYCKALYFRWKVYVHGDMIIMLSSCTSNLCKQSFVIRSLFDFYLILVFCIQSHFA